MKRTLIVLTLSLMVFVLSGCEDVIGPFSSAQVEFITEQRDWVSVAQTTPFSADTTYRCEPQLLYEVRNVKDDYDRVQWSDMTIFIYDEHGAQVDAVTYIGYALDYLIGYQRYDRRASETSYIPIEAANPHFQWRMELRYADREKGNARIARFPRRGGLARCTPR